MRIPRARPELRVELAGHEIRVVLDLDDLDELLFRPDAGDAQAVLLERLEVVVVDLIAMAVTLADDALAIQPRGAAALLQVDRIESQAHRAALVGERALPGQQVN